MNKGQILLDAINSLDKIKVDEVRDNTDLYDFMLTFSIHMSPNALIFLHNNYGINLQNIFSHIDVTKNQMDVLLQNGYKPSNDMILTYSGYLDLSLFHSLFDFQIKIPHTVVWHWKNILYIPALSYYLSHNGEPNIRPFMMKSKTIGAWESSLIDSWIAMQEDESIDACDQKKIDNVVNDLINHGAKKSPYAMTKKEKIAYWNMMEETPKQFVDFCTIKINELRNSLKTITNQIEYEECIWSINRFEQDIRLC